MDWIDYKDKLGIGLNDEQKQKFFITNIFNYLDNTHESVKYVSYLKYCLATGTKVRNNDTYFCYKNICDDLKEHSGELKEFISRYVLFANIIVKDGVELGKPCDYMALLKIQLENAHIAYEVIEVDGSTLIFPKGVPDFDKALISDNLIWLDNYPETKKAWIKALKRYSEVDNNSASEVADLYRKSLERFFQEFFSSDKSLENYKKEYGSFLEEKGVPKEISNELEKILNMYCKYNNNYAKHSDKASINVLEYIMYHTGIIIRLMITLSKQ